MLQGQKKEPEVGKST